MTMSSDSGSGSELEYVEEGVITGKGSCLPREYARFEVRGDMPKGKTIYKGKEYNQIEEFSEHLKWPEG